MNGWVGNILRVDLNKSEMTTESTASYVDQYVGGRGLGARLMHDSYIPGTNAFDPANPLVLNTGPLTGTAMPGSGRVDVTALSPMSHLRAKSNFAPIKVPD